MTGLDLVNLFVVNYECIFGVESIMEATHKKKTSQRTAFTLNTLLSRGADLDESMGCIPIVGSENG